MPLIHYLLVYDLRQQKLLSHDAYASASTAAAAYTKCEREYGRDSNVEIVLIGADSLETVQLTHGHYFDGEPSASPFLAGV